MLAIERLSKRRLLLASVTIVDIGIHPWSTIPTPGGDTDSRSLEMLGFQEILYAYRFLVSLPSFGDPGSLQSSLFSTKIVDATVPCTPLDEIVSKILSNDDMWVFFCAVRWRWNGRCTSVR